MLNLPSFLKNISLTELSIINNYLIYVNSTILCNQNAIKILIYDEPNDI